MSLQEMVKSAEFTRADALGVKLLSETQSEVSVRDLKEEVQRYVSLDDIASMLLDDPRRARSELTGACKQVFLNNEQFANSKSREAELTSALMDVVFGMGPIEDFIVDEDVTEIIINGASEIYIEKRGTLEKTDLQFEDDEQVRVLIDKILAPLGRRIDEASPMVNARLMRGHRVNAIIPPISPDGPMVTIRAFRKDVLSPEIMLESGSIEQKVYQFLKWIVLLRKNIVVSGGTGSGKTTMLNAASCFIPKGERVITIEDSLELKFSSDLHVVRLEARPQNTEGVGEVTIRDLVKNSLRMRPDRIIVGECRGGEALDMLQAMNTGHDGSMTTIHANSSEDVVERMTALVRYAVDLPIDAIMSQLGSAFDYIIQVKRDRRGNRYLNEISSVHFDRLARQISIEPLYSREQFDEGGNWFSDAGVPNLALSFGFAEAKEVLEWN